MGTRTTTALTRGTIIISNIIIILLLLSIITQPTAAALTILVRMAVRDNNHIGPEMPGTGIPA
jgi:hypothetical protein